MILSEIEKQLLALIELDADCSIVQIAQKLGLKPGRAQRILARLVEHNILLGRIAVLDVARLGYLECGLSLSTAFRSVSQRTEILTFLKQHKKVSWLAEAGGTHDILLNLIVRHSSEVLQFLNQFSAKFPKVLKGKSFYQRTLRVRLARGMFTSRSAMRKEFVSGQDQMIQQIDRVDQQILKTLSGSTHNSYRDLSIKCSVALSTVLRRVEELKAKKILLGFGARIDIEPLGYQQFRILLELRTVSLKLKKDIVALCRRHTFIKVIAECLGAWDYEIEIDTLQPSEISNFIAKLYDGFGEDIHSLAMIPILHIEKYISFPVYQDLKSAL
jgi:DNA-binding Lrp family transcriptional regulator